MMIPRSAEEEETLDEISNLRLRSCQDEPFSLVGR